MAKPEAKALEGTSEPFKCKTYVLRVSIHCEGCKRKVIKILHNINGVHAVEIDRKQQKVTVTTNTDEQTLIKRLIKAGKHAEPWPETKLISKNIKEKQIAVEIPAGESSAAVGDGGKQKQSTETEPPAEELQVRPKNEEKCGINENVEVLEISKGGDGHGDATETGGGGGGEGPAERAVKSPPSIAGETDPVVPSGAVAVEANCSGGGEGRKKKKKGQRKEKSGGAIAGEVMSPQTIPTPASIGSATPLDHHHDQIPPSNHSLPFNQPYNYPVHTVVSRPAYVANYNTVYPSSTSDAYYTSPPLQSYAYIHPAAPRNTSQPSSSLPTVEQSYAYVHSVAPRNISSLLSPSPPMEQSNSPPSSPFDFFSDENPSGCSIM
ncbi:heavy metal-associated isoprenylated plant protein 36-like [Benincasa hispida]|uniref:heavy metal-associated isoprenylated plant protein 36-like n=1 Tax=Benincasa hispida TaxID=102211 RepID=UPI0018FFE72B|nr:heavy metal-associated isoprenylated plant protein 36-like [Benincasa hispida]